MHCIPRVMPCNVWSNVMYGNVSGSHLDETATATLA